MNAQVTIIGLAVILMGGCKAESPSKPTVSSADQLTDFARTRLADLYYTTPFNCQDPWLAGDSNVIIALEGWAEDAGLRRGDQIVQIGRRVLSTGVSWDDAIRSLPKD